MNQPKQLLDRPLLSGLTDLAKEVFNSRVSEEAIETLIDQKLEKQRQSQLKPRRALSPSLFSKESCGLETYFGFFPDLYPYQDPQDPATRRKWTRASVLGDLVHDAWQSALMASALVMQRLDGRPAIEVELRDFDDIAAQDAASKNYSQQMRMDGLLSYQEGLEIKGIAGDKFNPFDRFFFSHFKLEQAQQYMYFYGLTSIHYVAVNRDSDDWFSSASVVEYSLERDEEVIGQMLRKAHDLHNAVTLGLQPDPAPPRGPYCRMLCCYRQHCSHGRQFI